MAATVFCVKRRIEDEPYDTFVLNCKRLKSADGNETPAVCATSNDGEIAQTFLTLAATFQSHTDISANLHKIQKSEADRHPRRIRKPSITVEKMRQQYKNDTKNQRFKIVDGTREIDTRISANGGDDIDRVTVIDIVKEAAGQLPSLDAENESAAAANEKFVYDVYLFGDGVQPQEWNLEAISSIQPFDDFVYQSKDESFNLNYDSDDSNDEANWRNDYPDTDNESIGEDDMQRVMQDLHLSDG